MLRTAAGVERRGLAELRGPMAFVESSGRVSLHEEVEIVGPDGSVRAGRVVATSTRGAVVEVFAPTDGMQLRASTVRFRGEPMRTGVGEELLGRIFDGLGRPRDGLPPPAFDELRPIGGTAINPCRREFPRDFVQTGISAIDLLTSVVLGQKIPIFTQAGLPHDDLAMQIIRQATAPGVQQFAIVFAALGIPREVAQRYVDDFRSTGARARLIAFLNLAGDPAAERLIAPRCALTAAEYLAFDRGYHVLVVLHDITNYGEALREISAARGEAPSRKGYPGYLYSDLASMFERAGRIAGRPGSLTQIPIVTLPAGDITHPVPDLTGYVTEGQIVLERDIARRGVYPPVAVLSSLSRLMQAGIGEGRTRADHPPVAKQLYAALARVERAQSLASIIGADELTEVERTYLRFGEVADAELLSQRPDENRTIGETLDRAWQALRLLPAEELTRIPAEMLREHGKTP